jgi:hypothetical protein
MANNVWSAPAGNLGLDCVPEKMALVQKGMCQVSEWVTMLSLLVLLSPGTACCFWFWVLG